MKSYDEMNTCKSCDIPNDILGQIIDQLIYYFPNVPVSIPKSVVRDGVVAFLRSPSGDMDWKHICEEGWQDHMLTDTSPMEAIWKCIANSEYGKEHVKVVNKKRKRSPKPTKKMQCVHRDIYLLSRTCPWRPTDMEFEFVD